MFGIYLKTVFQHKEGIGQLLNEKLDEQFFNLIYPLSCSVLLQFVNMSFNFYIIDVRQVVRKSCL